MDLRIVNIASYNRIDSLIKSLKSIYNQCDVINVCLNSHNGDIPEFLYSPKINLTFTNNSKGDAFKFLYLESSEGYFLTIDDDLIYPPGYVDYMISKCNEYNNEKIVTLHGRSFSNFPILSYYRSASERYSCLNQVKNDVKVQFGGTGVMCFHTSLLKKSINNFLYPNMADVWIGKFAKEKNIEIMCLAHSASYIKYIPQKTTIYEEESRSDRPQTNIVNEMFGFKSTTNLSIIIPTYNNVKFIDECIESIQNSNTNNNFEILIGIDGCVETKDYLLNQILPKNIKLFYFKDTLGPYTIKNTLATISTSNNLLFFDSDDIMNTNMIETILNGLNKYICVKPKFEEFGDKSLGGPKFGEGVFGIRKDVFLSMNGFEPWKMGADSDFMGRLYKKRVSILHTSQVLFKRRVHPGSLTNRKDTGMRSPLRAHYAKLSMNKKGDGNPSVLNIREYIDITVDSDIVLDSNSLVKEKNLSLKLLNKPSNVVIPKKEVETKEIDYDLVNKVIYNKNNNKNKRTNVGINSATNKDLNVRKKIFNNIRNNRGKI